MKCYLDGKNYVLNQCEDIWKWFKESVIGEYTRYYGCCCQSPTFASTEAGALRQINKFFKTK
jgi:hypothetical protein